MDRDVAQVVGRHEVHRVRAQQAHTVQFAPVQHELQKPRVIHGGGHQSAAARLQRGVFAHINQHGGLAAIRVMDEGFGHAVLLRGRH